jgi:uncharacterized protein DUF2442
VTCPDCARLRALLRSSAALLVDIMSTDARVGRQLNALLDELKDGSPHSPERETVRAMPDDDKPSTGDKKAGIRHATLVGGKLTVVMCDGRRYNVNISEHERLANAPTEAILNIKVVGGGSGLHWPDVDEDLSFAGMGG